jgi:hypothetical protein
MRTPEPAGNPAFQSRKKAPPVDEIVNARIEEATEKAAATRCHRISTVRGAVLDGWLKVVVDLPKVAE